MPNFDGSGPLGKGALTGRGAGKCGPGRPRIKRRLGFDTDVRYFKPQGIPLRNLEEVILSDEEIEAIKLYEVDGLDQKTSAKKMGISQPTFARTLDSANKKIADALINGKAIRIG
ncbi:DUF134 domain-containing protein [Patescibacteria group bacterium]